MAEKRLVYFADPMCSWCYGFSPVIGAIAERFEDRMPLDLVMGGLRAGNTSPMRPQDKDYIRNAWTRVNGATGQPFDFGFLDRDGFVYDTEPACRAVVTVRRMLPRLALGFMGRIQQAFYAENRDMTSADAIADVAEEAGLEREAFTGAFLAPDTRNETFRDFLTAQQLGVHGFPTLIAGSEAEGYALVTNGYRPLEDILDPMERWWASGAPVKATPQQQH
jgi:putative protein-disulfide isomerase